MTYHGRVKNGVIELSGGPRPPEGAEVRVEVIEPSTTPAADDSVYSLDELAVDTGVPDLSVNLDHYLYGYSKASSDG